MLASVAPERIDEIHAGSVRLQRAHEPTSCHGMRTENGKRIVMAAGDERFEFNVVCFFGCHRGRCMQSVERGAVQRTCLTSA